MSKRHFTFSNFVISCLKINSYKFSMTLHPSELESLICATHPFPHQNKNLLFNRCEVSIQKCFATKHCWPISIKYWMQVHENSNSRWISVISLGPKDLVKNISEQTTSHLVHAKAYFRKLSGQINQYYEQKKWFANLFFFLPSI